MPLRLIPPSPGRTSFYRVRGTHLRVYVDRTTGQADERKARAVLRQIEADIESGAISATKPLTFADAALSYLQAGGERTFLKRVVDHFGPHRPLDSIRQADIDACAVSLYPTATPATRNRQVYTPVSAVLRHAGVTLALRRPKGAEGQQKLNWLWPEQAELVLREASKIDPEYGAFWTSLIYTGLRLGEATVLWHRDKTDLSEAVAHVPYTKNGARTWRVDPCEIRVIRSRSAPK